MSCCCDCSDDGPGSKVQPASSYESSADDNIFIKRRSCTDIIAFIILIALICGFAYFVVPAFKKGDIYRVINGYDDCGNVCGRVTPAELDKKFCKGADMTRKPYLFASISGTGVKSKQCVANCSEISTDYITFLNRCIPKEISETSNSVIKRLGLDSMANEAARDLAIIWRELIYLFLIALVISLLLLVAFRYFVDIIIYVLLTLVVMVSVGGSCFLWYKYFDEKKAVEKKEIYKEDSSEDSYMIYAIILTIITFFILLVVLVMRKRIALVIQLFKEAGKAVYAMPALLFQPIYTYFFVGITVVGCVYLMMWIESAGDLYMKKHRTGGESARYKKDAILMIARWYNVFIFFVLNEFYLGCQHMVVAGAVARWFFTREKRRLHLAVTRSAWTLIRYHLGTVAFGSLVIGIVRLIRYLMETFQKYLKKYDNSVFKFMLTCCRCCMACFENILRFLGRNAYIETAIYGCGFCTGGKKAFQAVSNNILRVAAINSVGDFVLLMGKILVVALTMICGIFLIQKKDGVQHPMLPICLAGIVAFIIAHCFISIYEMIIDTIFICFCEDCAKNDGISRPYYMSKGLMEFVENSKKAIKNLEKREAQRQHYQTPSHQIYPNQNQSPTSQLYPTVPSYPMNER